MVQKAKKLRTSADRFKAINDHKSTLYALSRRSQSPVTSGSAFLGNFGGSAGGSTAASGNFLKTKGDTMVGPIAFFPQLTTISNGQIDISEQSGNYSSRVIVSPESGSTDNLLTITGAGFAGQLLFIQGVETDTLTIIDSKSNQTDWVTATVYALDDIIDNGGNAYVCKSAHTSGDTDDEPGMGATWETYWYKANIETIEGSDFTLENDDILIFMYDTTDSAWQQITSGKQAVGGGSSAHTIQEEGASLTARPNLNFIGGVVTATDNAGTNATDITITGAADNLGNHIATMILDMNGQDITSTVNPTTNPFKIIFDGHDDSDTFINNSTTSDKITITSNGTAVLEILDTEVLFNSTTPLNMNTSEINSVGFISFGADPADSGRIRLPNGAGGAIKWESTPTGFDGEMYFDNDFNWFVDSGQAYKYWVGGFQVLEVDSAGIDLQLNSLTNARDIEVNSNTTTAGIRDVGFTSDPSVPLEGNLYYNTTSKMWKFYNGTSWLNVGEGAGDNLGDHTATEALKMEDNAIFFDTGQLHSIISLSDAINYVNDTAIGGSHDFYVDDLVIPKFGITETSIESNVTLDMNGKNIISSVAPATDIFQIVFDAHEDSDTFISNGLTDDKISIQSNGTAVIEILDTEVLWNSTTPLNMNTSNIHSIDYISFGADPADSGRIRLPNGATGAIKWESTPAGFDGEMYFDNDFNWFVDTSQAYKYWIGGFQTLEINEDGIDLQLNSLTNARNIEVNSNTTTAGIRDVGFTADPSVPLDGNLYYNTTSKMWRYYNGTAWGNLGGGATELDDLTDVNIGTPSANTVLKWSGSFWVDGNIVNANIDAGAAIAGSKIDMSIDELNDVTIGTPSANTVLKWSGSAWVDGNIVNANIDAGAAIDITKLDITGTPDGTKFLRDDGTWAASTGADNLGDHTATEIIKSVTFGLQGEEATQTIIGTTAGTGWVYSVPTDDTHIFNINSTPELTVAATSINVHDNAITQYAGWTAAIGQASAVDTLGVTWDVPTTDVYLWNIAGTDYFTVTEGGVGINNVTLSMNNQKIVNLGDPTGPQDAVTLAYFEANDPSRIAFRNSSVEVAAVDPTTESIAFAIDGVNSGTITSSDWTIAKPFITNSSATMNTTLHVVGQVDFDTGLDMNFGNITQIGTGTIFDLTEDASPNGATDYVMTYDATGPTMKKVLLDNLPGGGGGGISFPIEPTVTDLGDTWAGPQTLNLSTGDGHVYKWILDQNLTFAATVSNVPADNTQRTFELEFVHDGVGGTFTVTLPTSPAFVDENGVTLASFDVALDARAILACRVNEGSGGNIIVLQKNVAAVGAGASALPDLSDVTITIANDKDYLRFNGSAWVDSPIVLTDIALTSASIILGDGTGTAADVAMSGDITIDNAGVTTIGAAKVDFGMLSATGTPDGTKFLRDDYTWVTPAGGSGDAWGDPVDADIVPNAAVTWNLGSATAEFANVYLGRVQFTSLISEEPSQASIQLVNNGGNDDMIFNVPSSTLDRFVWDMAGGPEMTLDKTDLYLGGKIINWEDSGMDHTITPSTTALNINLGASTDTFRVEAAGTDIVEIQRDVGNGRNYLTIEGGTTSIDPVLRLYQNATTGDGSTIGDIVWSANNASAALTDYVKLQGWVNDNTNATEESALDVIVLSGGAEKIMMHVSGGDFGTAEMKLGFFDLAVGSTQATSTNSTPTADLTYSSNERDMIQDMWDALVAYGLLDES